MKTENYSKGRYAETLAARLLEDKGYIIIEKNYSKRFGEIDIIASKGNTLVFVEVKSKTGELAGLPEEMLTKSKLRQVKRMAEIYLTKRPDFRKKYKVYQIDGICIELQANFGIKRINHYENLQC